MYEENLTKNENTHIHHWKILNITCMYVLPTTIIVIIVLVHHKYVKLIYQKFSKNKFIIIYI